MDRLNRLKEALIDLKVICGAIAPLPPSNEANQFMATAGSLSIRIMLHRNEIYADALVGGDRTIDLQEIMRYLGADYGTVMFDLAIIRLMDERKHDLEALALKIKEGQLPEALLRFVYDPKAVTAKLKWDGKKGQDAGVDVPPTNPAQ